MKDKIANLRCLIYDVIIFIVFIVINIFLFKSNFHELYSLVLLVNLSLISLFIYYLSYNIKKIKFIHINKYGLIEILLGSYMILLPLTSFIVLWNGFEGGMFIICIPLMSIGLYLVVMGIKELKNKSIFKK